jgi:hypothetical protein
MARYTRDSVQQENRRERPRDEPPTLTALIDREQLAHKLELRVATWLPTLGGVAPRRSRTSAGAPSGTRRPWTAGSPNGRSGRSRSDDPADGVTDHVRSRIASRPSRVWRVHDHPVADVDAHVTAAL